MRNGQAYQRKTEKFSVSEEKKFGKIDSWCRDVEAISPGHRIFQKLKN